MRVSSNSLAEAEAPVSPTASDLDQGRFPAGVTIAGRYRIISLIGRGGLGEVYKANDLKLDQVTALKFLPLEATADPLAIDRLKNEIRLARQVSHPNVCRVLDLGDANGQSFLSMEYIDGENLASLLRRIGRLPSAQAIQIARELCAGLGAGHAKGVIHRDLKPANIMIDGQGNALIMDFGVGGIEYQVRGAEDRAGASVYMAPEQKARGVSVQTDLYSLGLVLYEMFSGRPWDSHIGEPQRLGSDVTDLDPLVESAIQRCLREDPSQRPSSASAVVAALPGGTPMQAAIEAGQMPTPEEVAAAGDQEGFSAQTIGLLLGAVLLGVALNAWLVSRIFLPAAVGLNKPPEVMAERAREIARQAGYTREPAQRDWSFEGPPSTLVTWLMAHHLRWHDLPGMAIRFTYRESTSEGLNPLMLLPLMGRWQTGPFLFPESFLVRLDGLGRLLSFNAVPPDFEQQTENQAGTFDWKALLQAAGRDPGLYREVAPELTPSRQFDEHKAWLGRLNQIEGVEARLEAAAFRGKLVWFVVEAPWSPRLIGNAMAPVSGDPIVLAFLIAGAGILAGFRNLRLGRGDRAGALRLAVVIGLGNLISNMLAIPHSLAAEEFYLWFLSFSSSLFWAFLAWILYLALEPYIRRRWPTVLISWNRLLSGDGKDSLVASHILAGFALGLWAGSERWISHWVRSLGGDSPIGLQYLNGGADLIRGYIDVSISIIQLCLLALVAASLVRVVVRRDWLVILVVPALVWMVFALQGFPIVSVLTGYASWVLMFAALIRFGFVTFLSGFMVNNLFTVSGFASHTRVWYAANGWLTVALILAIAFYAAKYALAGRTMLHVARAE